MLSLEELIKEETRKVKDYESLLKELEEKEANVAHKVFYDKLIYHKSLLHYLNKGE